MYIIYGLANCDSVRKTVKWMKAQQLPFQLHDFRKDGLHPQMVESWVAQVGLETLLNKKSTTWQELNDLEKAAATTLNGAIDLMVNNPNLIKRPVVENEGKIVSAGFPTIQHWLPGKQD